MTGDVWREPAAADWARQVHASLGPKVAESAVCVTIVPGGDALGDVKLWVETGAMIWLDKPFTVTVVPGDREVPHRLALIADEIVRLPEGVNGPGSDALAEAIIRVTDRLDERKHDDDDG